MKQVILLFTLLIAIGNYGANAQVSPARFAVEFNAGVPLMLGSVPASLSTYGGIGVRYNLTTAISFQGSMNIGTMLGRQDQQIAAFPQPETVSNIKSFRTDFYTYSIRGQLNLDRVLGLRQYNFFNRINPYLIVGGGYTAPRGDGIVAERYFGTTKVYKDGFKDFYTVQGGLAFRYYLNPALDLNLGCEFNYTQTYYLDGAFQDKKYDHFLLNYIGINYKIGASKKRQHIEWMNIRFIEKKPRKPRPDNETEPQPDPILAKQERERDSIEAAQTQAKQDSLIASQSKPSVDSSITSIPDDSATAAADTAKREVKTIKDQATLTGSKPVGEPVRQKVKPAAGGVAAASEGITETPFKYNVVVGAYQKTRYAFIFRDQMRKKGYEQASVYRTGSNSRMLRVVIVSTDDRQEALKALRKARKEIDPQAWMQVLNP